MWKWFVCKILQASALVTKVLKLKRNIYLLIAYMFMYQFPSPFWPPSSIVASALVHYTEKLILIQTVPFCPSALCLTLLPVFWLTFWTALAAGDLHKDQPVFRKGLSCFWNQIPQLHLSFACLSWRCLSNVYSNIGKGICIHKKRVS